jgi:hypothetical protein
VCREIKTLANFDPPATDEEIRASATQFVRKLSGTSRPSRANELVFDRAVDEVTAAAARLIRSLSIAAPPRDREEETRKARERSRRRFG